MTVCGVLSSVNIEWAVEKELVSASETTLDEAALEHCFREMCLMRSSLDLGPGGHRSDWLTSSTKEWYSNQHNGRAKLSKNQFSTGLRTLLSIDVPWANVDALWRRMVKPQQSEEEWDLAVVMAKPPTESCIHTRHNNLT
jgi:hypothetical protein